MGMRMLSRCLSLRTVLFARICSLIVNSRRLHESLCSATDRLVSISRKRLLIQMDLVVVVGDGVCVENVHSWINLVLQVLVLLLLVLQGDKARGRLVVAHGLL